MKRLQVLLASSCVYLAPSVAAAQGPDADLEWLSVTAYEVPPECPPLEEFERHVRRRLSFSRATPPRTRVRVRVEGESSAVVGEIAFERIGDLASRRQIRGHDCGEAIEGLALILALAADVPPQGDTDAAAARADAADDDARRTNELSPESALEKPAEPSKASFSPFGKKAMTASPQWGTSLSFVVASGMAPQPAFGGQFGLEVASPLLKSLSVAGRVGYRGLFERSQASEEGTARFSFWSVLAAACAGPVPSDRWFVSGCAVGEYGRLSAAGGRTENPRTASRPWAALGAAVWLRFRPFSFWVLQVDGEVLAPVNRDRFLIGSVMVHEVPGLVFRAEMGAGVQFP